MNLFSGEWFSLDGFGLRLTGFPNDKIYGSYLVSLPDEFIDLPFKGVSLCQDGTWTFGAVLECDRCQPIGWAGKITLHGTLDPSHSTMILKWLCTSGLRTRGEQPKFLGGKTLLLSFYGNLQDQSGFSSELFAPHTLFLQERDPSVPGVKKPAAHPGQRKRKR